MQDPEELHMPGAETASFTGHDVVDEAGNRLGTVEDLISDSSTLEPRWMVVGTGKLKASHFVPVAGSYRSAEGDIVVPFTDEMVKHSPKATRDHVLSPETDRELRDYYHLAS